MRVAVLGSWRAQDRKAWSLRESPAAFQAACRRIGSELARRGHSLIVGSDSDHTADAHAVLGALDGLPATPATQPRILMVRRGEPAASAFDVWQRDHPGVFVEHRVQARSEAVVKLAQVSLADAVILVGGAEHTEAAGVAAALSGKPLACIGSFGGAAHQLNERFTDAPARWRQDPQAADRLRLLQGPFSEFLLTAALEAAWIEGAPKLMLIHGRSPDRDALKQYLLRHVGRVVVLADEFAPSEPIPIKFERYASSVDGAIALVTPDDVGGLAAAPPDDIGLSPAPPGAAGGLPGLAPRARENVWIEVGWFWGCRGRRKLLLLTKGDVALPSDLGNVEHYDYASDPTEGPNAQHIQRFIERLRAAGDADGA